MMSDHFIFSPILIIKHPASYYWRTKERQPVLSELCRFVVRVSGAQRKREWSAWCLQALLTLSHTEQP